MRNNKRCIWTSSYDRGLEHLLNMWPEIKKEVPEAELQITYGWNLFMSVYGPTGLGPNPERQAWKEKMDKKMKQPGITHIGRVGQQKMVELLQQSGIWAYPTDFDEISCISAMKAQIYGAIPVTMNRAALKETVRFGVQVDGDIADKQVQKEYIKYVVDWLKDENKQKSVRKEMCDWAREEFSWIKVAESWSIEFQAPKVYSNDWLLSIWKKLPSDLRKEEFKSYRLDNYENKSV
jgi:glycosyltransferase involved in cell wall biosynthesis